MYITVDGLLGEASLQDAIKLECIDSGVSRAEKGEGELTVDLTSEYQIYCMMSQDRHRCKNGRRASQDVPPESYF